MMNRIACLSMADGVSHLHLLGLWAGIGITAVIQLTFVRDRLNFVTVEQCFEVHGSFPKCPFDVPFALTIEPIQR